MNWTSLAKRIRGWKAEIVESHESVRSAPQATNSPEWYTGLAVSPVAFSNQLGELQISLQRANTVPEEATKMQRTPRYSAQPK